MSAEQTSAFVPAPWADKHVVLQSARGQNWTRASIDGVQAERTEAGNWAVAGVQPGAWNAVNAEGGSLDGARLVASERLHISTLEATVGADRSLSVRVRLSEGALGPVTIVLTVSAADGRQVGGTEVMLSRKTRELSVALPLSYAKAGSYRLKASVSDGDHVNDNARIEVRIP